MAFHELRPVRLPKVRDKLVWYFRDGPAAMYMHQAPAGGGLGYLPGVDCGGGEFAVRQWQPPTMDVARSFCNRTADALHTGEMYWISSEFSQLAMQAGRDLPDLTFDAAEVPAPSGLIVFATPIFEHSYPSANPGISGTLSVVAVSWMTLADGLWVTNYGIPEHIMPGLPRARVRTMIGLLMPHSPGGGARFGVYDNHAQGTQLLATLLATWFLIAQPGVAEITDSPADKADAKRYARAGRPAPAVRVVDLRRRTQNTDDQDRQSPQYKVRWMVKGHWRKAHYRQGQRRERIYISPHLKGPENAPLKETPPAPTVRRLQ